MKRDSVVNRRRLLRWTGVSIGTAAVSVLAAACSSSPPASPTAAASSNAAAPAAPTATTGAASAPTTAAAPAPTAAAATTKSPTTLTIWAGSFANLQKRLQATPKDTGAEWAQWVVSHFEQANPGVTIQAEDHGWSAALRTALLTAIAGHTVPDVTTGEAFVHEFGALGAFATVPTNDKFVASVSQEAEFKGQFYGIPAYTSPFALETNVTVANEAGLDPNTPPKTWDELLQNSIKAATAGKGKYFGFNVYGAAPSLIYGTVLRAMPWINQTGHPLGDDLGTKILFNDPGALPAYELCRNLFKTADPGNSFSGDEGKIYSFLWQNKAVYQESAVWNIFNAQDFKAQTLYHPLPTKVPNKTGNVPLGTEIFSPLKASKIVDSAAAFCAFLGTPDTQSQVGNILGQRLPTNIAVLASPDLTKAAGYQGVEGPIKTFADILANETMYPIPPYTTNADKIWTVWSDAFAKVLQTSESIQSIMDSAQNQAQHLLS
jgi:multiple sugar transport system substrate-binding protein